MKVYDLIGIGIGPYHLGLAALTTEKSDLQTLFFDQSGQFSWHPGMLIEGTDLQVSFLADLTTFANPTSNYTFLNYLHKHDRLYNFFLFHEFEIPRTEYADYLKWVAEELPNCHFQSEVQDVIDHGDHYEVVVNHWKEQKVISYFTKHVVLGSGSTPLIPFNVEAVEPEEVYHSSQYMYHKEHTIKSKHISIAGSGQSASEIFYDLLKLQEVHDFELSWYTRSPGFLEIDSSKLGQETFTPDYVNYFQQLSFQERLDSLDHLGKLRNGIDSSTLHKIYGLLYHRSVGGKSLPVKIQPLTEIKKITKQNNQLFVEAEQWQQKTDFSFHTNTMILATGYKPNIPSWFYQRFEEAIEWEDDKRFKVDKNFKLVFKEKERNHHFYTLTNLEHSHGTGATNLGLAVDRNIRIINEVAGKTVYEQKLGTIFTSFGLDQ